MNGPVNVHKLYRYVIKIHIDIINVKQVVIIIGIEMRIDPYFKCVEIMMEYTLK